MTRGWVWILGGLIALLLLAAAVWFGMTQVVEGELRGVPLP